MIEIVGTLVTAGNGEHARALGETANLVAITLARGEVPVTWASAVPSPRPRRVGSQQEHRRSSFCAIVHRHAFTRRCSVRRVTRRDGEPVRPGSAEANEMMRAVTSSSICPVADPRIPIRACGDVAARQGRIHDRKTRLRRCVIFLANRGWSIHVVLFQQHRTDQPDDRCLVGGNMPTTSAGAQSSGDRDRQLGARWAGRCHIMTCELALVIGRPCDQPGCAASADPYVSCCPRRLLTRRLRS
jgi:hypothetical protein